MTFIRVIDGRPVSNVRKDFTFARSNQNQSFTQKNFEPRQSGPGRTYAKSAPGSPQLDGFGRTDMIDQKSIMQGYMGADDDDMNDWEFAVTMEHPEVMNGIQAMQGKKNRQEKKAARKEKKAQKAADKKSVRPAKAKRQQKRAERTQRRTDKKDLKLAKKEEKLLKRQSKREQRVLDKEARRERKDKREERKGKRSENIKEIFADLGDKARDVVSDIVTRPGEFDMTASDFNIPGDGAALLDRWRGMPLEDVFDEREELDEIVDSRAAEDGGKPAKPAAGDDSGGGAGTGALIAIAAVAALALGGGGKKKGKKKK